MRRQNRADRRTKQTGETRSKHPAKYKSDTCDERTNQNTKRRLMKEDGCGIKQFPSHDSSDLPFGANANHFVILKIR